MPRWEISFTSGGTVVHDGDLFCDNTGCLVLDRDVAGPYRPTVAFYAPGTWLTAERKSEDHEWSGPHYHEPPLTDVYLLSRVKERGNEPRYYGYTCTRCGAKFQVNKISPAPPRTGCPLESLAQNVVQIHDPWKEKES